MDRPPRVPRILPGPTRRPTDTSPKGEEPKGRGFWSDFEIAVLITLAALAGFGLATWLGRQDPGFTRHGAHPAGRYAHSEVGDPEHP